jgi:hypothetical protein
VDDARPRGVRSVHRATIKTFAVVIVLGARKGSSA